MNNINAIFFFLIIQYILYWVSILKKRYSHNNNVYTFILLQYSFIVDAFKIYVFFFHSNTFIYLLHFLVLIYYNLYSEMGKTNSLFVSKYKIGIAF